MTQHQQQPTQKKLGEEGMRFRHVAMGRTHAAAVTVDGELWTWGNPELGKLGHGVNELPAPPSAWRLSKPPKKPERTDIARVRGALEEQRVVQAACGFNHTVCLTEDGEVYSFGQGKFGALGHGAFDQLGSPKRVEALRNVVKVASGGDFSLCLDQDGRVFAFGSNLVGQLGLSGVLVYRVNYPQQLVLPNGVVAVDIACGEEHAALLTDAGEVFTWGYGSEGALGHRRRRTLSKPKLLSLKKRGVRVRCGGGHTGVVTDEGELYLFGRGRDG